MKAAWKQTAGDVDTGSRREASLDILAALAGDLVDAVYGRRVRFGIRGVG